MDKNTTKLLTGAELVEVLTRLADGDGKVRLPRSTDDPTEGANSSDELAATVNRLAETLEHLQVERSAIKTQLEADVWQLSDLFLRFSQGDFSVRSNRGDTGKPMDVLCYLFDNTVADVSKLFGEVKAQRSLLDSMLNSMVDMVFLLSPDGHIQKANEAAAFASGFGQKELEDKHISDLLASGDRHFSAALSRVREEAIAGRDTRFQVADGSVSTWVVNASAVTDDQKQLVGVVLTGRDERELRKARSQLQMTDRLATMGSLAAGVAHEINNPLSFVMSNLEFAIEEIEASVAGEAMPQSIRAEIQQALQTAYDGTERVAAIVRDLKSVSRVESDAVSGVNINKLLDSAAAMLQHEIRHRAILKKDYGAEFMVLANEARAMQVFLNLIQNAAQAMPVGSASANSITLRTWAAEDRRVCIEVADTGCGIAEDDMQCIFDDFFTTKEVGVGTGLGLSISHRLVTQMGGGIEVESGLGRGTAFRVYLPAAEALPQKPRTPSPPASVKEVSRQRVLVIDDEAQIGQAVRRLLKKDYEVDLSVCGQDALVAFEQHRHHIIICDLKMPEMSGPDFRLAVHERFPACSAAFIFMTGGDVDAERGELKGAHEILEKPFSPTTLRAAVANLARA